MSLMLDYHHILHDWLPDVLWYDVRSDLRLGYGQHCNCCLPWLLGRGSEAGTGNAPDFVRAPDVRLANCTLT